MSRRPGVSAVEIRHDLKGVGLTDGTPAKQVGDATKGNGMTLRSINALQGFEQFDAAREAEAVELAKYAVASGTQAMRAFEEIGAEAKTTFVLVHDTFHHHLAGEGLFFPEWTGLVHISGVDDKAVTVADMRGGQGHRTAAGIKHGVLARRGERNTRALIEAAEAARPRRAVPDQPGACTVRAASACTQARKASTGARLAWRAG